MNITVVDEQKNVVEEPKREINTDVNPIIKTEPFLVDSISDMFDLKPSEKDMYRSKINTLIDYARSKVSDPTPENVKWALRSLGLKLGTPPLGEKLINYLTQYAYLHMEGKKINEQLNKFEQQ